MFSNVFRAFRPVNVLMFCGVRKTSVSTELCILFNHKYRTRLPKSNQLIRLEGKSLRLLKSFLKKSCNTDFGEYRMQAERVKRVTFKRVIEFTRFVKIPPGGNVCHETQFREDDEGGNESGGLR